MDEGNAKITDDYVAIWDQVYALSVSTLPHSDKMRELSALGKVKVGSSQRGYRWSTLREIRGVHMGAGRLTGKDSWINVFLKNNKETIVISGDYARRDDIQSRYGAGIRELYYRKSDIAALMKQRDMAFIARLIEARYIIINDSSYNLMSLSKDFEQSLSGYLRDDVIIIMMG